MTLRFLIDPHHLGHSDALALTIGAWLREGIPGWTFEWFSTDMDELRTRDLVARSGINAPAVPVRSRLEAILQDGNATFLVSDPACAATAQQFVNLFPVAETNRHNQDQNATGNQTIMVDDYSQLDVLRSLHRYPGMTALLGTVGSRAEDYRQSVLARFAHPLLKLDTERRAAVFGAQRLGQLVSQGLTRRGINVVAFIDNNPSKWGTTLGGIPVLSLDSISERELPIVIATTKYTHTISDQLARNGFVGALPYSTMTLYDEDHFPSEIPYRGIQDDFAHNVCQYVSLFLRLADDRSREVLDGLVHYRLTYDTAFVQPIADAVEKHYFDSDLIHIGDGEVFVDAGGFDGDTVIRFIQQANGRFKKVYLFEPDPKLLERARRNLSEFASIEFLNAGVYSTDTTLSFSTTGVTNGTFADGGDIDVKVRAIDSVVGKVAPTFIKMDIEGAEEEALIGARGHIGRSRPKLAIAAYHRAQDIWHLALLIQRLNPHYRLFLRHYSETGLETVLYAI